MSGYDTKSYGQLLGNTTSINANIIRVIESLYGTAQSTVLFNGSTGDWFIWKAETVKSYILK